ncbi:hypothetical protein, variant [Cladophialophora immunda]|nr:hypothetical protein, variant [Cladophialophora immunda]KIW32934.1 hypothetical protein, variant [Cladophialophora immunda]
MGQIGDRLPHFRKYLELFKSNDTLKRLLLVFLRDILEFHVTALNFFKSKKWELYFESMWPKYGNKITIIMNNIERHAALISNEVTLTSIQDAQAAYAEALKTYERDGEFQRRQDFATVQQSLSPRLYDDDLETFRKRRSPDSGKWIEKNGDFSAWLNTSNKTKQILWVEGIPGAGKSYLSAYIVDIAQRQVDSCTVFAFLSFQDQKLTTAKVLQSLIFQLALENVDLHQALCREVQSNYRGVSSNTACLRTLFVKMLQMSNPTYIVVDGVDEIDENERSFLLRTLLEAKKECNEVKLLISSRGEDNILRIMRREAIRIHLQANNLADIQCFVRERTNEWLSCSAFDECTAAEIRNLLAPLASKSEGMILYARLVLDNISYLSSLHSIKEELSALPRGLDEAYGRILLRITEVLSKIDRGQVKRILSWIAGSQVSLQKRELEAAFSIREGVRSISKESRVFLNVLHLCGPIVEVQDDDTIRFVHFTAKQFLANQQNELFIDLQYARLDICRTCITFLGFECLEYEEDEDIKQAILSGQFVFFHYAATQWIAHLNLYIELQIKKPERDVLCEEVQDLVQRMESFNQIAPSSTIQPRNQDFHSIKNNWPDLSAILSQEHAYMRFKAPFTSLQTVTLFDSESPLNIFAIYGKFYQTLDSMLCPDTRHRPECSCQTLKNLYGQFIYKCDRIACRHHRHGFDNRKERDQHLLGHDRPFKCPESVCAFSEIGFKSGQSLSQHMDQCHPTQNPVTTKHPAIQDIDPESVEVVLTEAVKAGEVGFVSKLLGNIPKKLADTLYIVALRSSDPAMVAQFVSSGFSIDKADIPRSAIGTAEKVVPLNVAIRACNFEVVRYLLATGCDRNRSDFPYECPMSGLVNWGTALDHAIGLSLPQKRLEAISALTDNGTNIHEDYRYSFKPLRSLLRRKNVEAERVVIQTLELLKRSFSLRDLNELLRVEADGGCSVEVGRWLIQNGARADDRPKNPVKYSALHRACNKRTENAAYFVKCLLESGVDPALRAGHPLAVEPKGAKNISTWLGVTWEELIESTKSARRAKE